MPIAETGARQRVAITDTDNVILYFTGLFTQEKATKSPVEPLLGVGTINTTTEPQKPVERLVEGLESQQVKQLHLEVRSRKRARGA